MTSGPAVGKGFVWLAEQLVGNVVPSRADFPPAQSRATILMARGAVHEKRRGERLTTEDQNWNTEYSEWVRLDGTSELTKRQRSC